MQRELLNYIMQEQSNLNDLHIGELRGRMAAALELAELPYESLKVFYTVEEEEKNAAEIV